MLDPAAGRALCVCLGCGLGRRWPPRDPGALRAHYETDYQPDARRAEEVGRSRRALFGAYLPRLARETAGRRLLDLGCGRGHFLELAAARGWDGLGLELVHGSAAAGRARGVRIVEGGDEVLDDLAGAFDVATLWNVLDQMPSLPSTLPRLHGALAEGGVLFVRVPNLVFHLAVHRAWRLLGLPGRSPALFHDLAFGPASLRALLQRSGFTRVRVENSRSTDVRPLPLRWALQVGAAAVAALSAQRLLVAPSLVAFAVRGAA